MLLCILTAAIAIELGVFAGITIKTIRMHNANRDAARRALQILSRV